LLGAQATPVVPAQAGTHNHSVEKACTAGGYGSRLALAPDEIRSSLGRDDRNLKPSRFLTHLAGPWRAIPVLGVTQILAWGAIFYPPVLTVPLIAAERGWSLAFTMGGFSLGLAASGLAAPLVGSLIDRHGGHWVMAAGSLIGAAGLVGLAYAADPVAYLLIWVVLGVAMAAGLYTPAFSSLGRIFGAEARRPITTLTLIAGFASTVSWPTTYFLIEKVGLRGTFLIYAALLALVAAPLHAFALPRHHAHSRPAAPDKIAPTQQPLPARGTIFLLVAAAFAAYAFVPSALGAHMLAIFDRMGLEPRTVVLIGMLFGPAQVAARLCEFFFAREMRPLLIVRFSVALLLAAFALLLLLGVSTPVAAAFAILFGVCNGLITIATGTVPLALFGAEGYGRLLGRIGGLSRLLQAIAPLTIAFAAERLSDPTALAIIAAFAAVALFCFLLIRRPA
jgi:MFS family permease